MTEVKAKKPRAPKALPAGDILVHFNRLNLEDKLAVQSVIAKEISEEKKKLEEQLKLIEAATK